MANSFSEPKIDDFGNPVCANCSALSDHLAFSAEFEYWGCPACLFEAARVLALEADEPPCTCGTPGDAPCELHSRETAYGRAWDACFLTPAERTLVVGAGSMAEVAARLAASKVSRNADRAPSLAVERHDVGKAA
jgi:hypothetical protein